MTLKYFARIKKSSQYSHQDTDKPFSVVPNTTHFTYARDGYLWCGGPGGWYRHSDLNLFVEHDGQLVPVSSRKK